MGHPWMCVRARLAQKKASPHRQDAGVQAAHTESKHRENFQIFFLWNTAVKSTWNTAVKSIKVTAVYVPYWEHQVVFSQLSVSSARCLY